jgi:hypothetical protein
MPDPRHRLLRLALARSIGSAADPDVFRVLMPMREEDCNPLVAQAVTVIPSHLLDKRLAAEVEAARKASGR